MYTASPRSKRSIHIGSLLVAVVVALFAMPSCRSSLAEKPESITVAAPALEQNALLYVADSRRFFARRGLKVTINDYDSGPAAIRALAQGTADVAETAEFPFVLAVLNKNRVSALAVNDRMMNVYLLARKDRGIESVSDLRGKRIGMARGTIVDFFLGRFLQLNSLSAGDVTLVDLSPSQFVDAIVNGDVDALAGWQPHVYQAMRQPGAALTVWSIHNGQPTYGMLISSNDWIQTHESAVERFLGSLDEAQRFIAAYPDDAKNIVERRLRYDSAYLDTVWPQHQFSLSLDFSLVIAMNDEARWLVDNNLTSEQAPPDFANSIYLDGLKAVVPEAVTTAP